MTDDTPTAPEGRQSGTRQRIQQVALELFAEYGYDKTSLREIAERLGVTKAALYYHFKSKEAIIAAVFEEILEEMDGFIAWTKTQPRTSTARQQIAQRYVESSKGASSVMRLFQENGPAMRELKVGEQMRDRLIDLVNTLTPEHASVPDKLRIRIALFAVQLSRFSMQDVPVEELDAAIVEVVFELLDRVSWE
ncbi:TetR/AcrR family transcriptional regulator [Fodinicola feengrottensis]|uniref:TetR family transcriptional regulator n=1 Tax=Fodinicola feengrottensis TaxID=435914 RepID=A0ABN2HEF2_9ACTN|nr:TetR/AcrR family transcriptional regulator [Fodinicola feengrottensis]